MQQNSQNTIVIEGITLDGQKFRPSDWAERLCGNLSTFRNQRIHYSPLLNPSKKNGINCLMISSSLKETNPELFSQVMDFAEQNRLRVYYP